MTTNSYRWGIISTGHIAGVFAQGLQHVEDADLVAVASRSQERADEFGQQYNIERRYDSYEALAADPTIDIVYIGTPHVFHYENMLLCLNAGKHVLCEKPFTIHAGQARECIALAREKGLFLMEAVWMRYLPAIVQLRQWLAEGVLGAIHHVHADFSVKLPYDPDSRLFDLELGGGALLDVGIYPINFAVMILGLPQQVHSHMHMGETGVDSYESLHFVYEDAAALLSASITHDGPCEAVIHGEKGYVRLHREFWNPTRLTLHLHDDEARTMEFPYEGTGLNYEAQEVHRCLRAGQTESDVQTLDETLAILQQMDAIRLEHNLRYPADES